MKLKVSYKNGTSKAVELDRIEILQSKSDTPIMMNLHSVKDGKIVMHATSNFVPEANLLEKIEIVE
jgi:hypothetical protein